MYYFLLVRLVTLKPAEESLALPQDRTRPSSRSASPLATAAIAADIQDAPVPTTSSNVLTPDVIERPKTASSVASSITIDDVRGVSPVRVTSWWRLSCLRLGECLLDLDTH